MGLDIISEGKGKCLLKEPKWSERNIHQQNIGSFGRFSYDLEMKTREHKTETTKERKYIDLIGLSNGYKRTSLLVG